MSEASSSVGLPASEQVKLSELGGYYSALGAVLAESGFSEDQLRDVFSRSISAECVQCGILLTSEELNRVATAGPEATFPENKLERVRQGYCGRRECNSYFYRLNLGAVPQIDWTQVKSKVGEKLSGGAKAEEKPETPLPKKGSTALPIRKIALAIGLILAALVFKWWWWDGSIPILQKKTTYEVDPKSAQSDGLE